MTEKESEAPAPQTAAPACSQGKPKRPPAPLPQARREEIGGPAGPEPTRYGDWERKGRCIDF